MELDRIPVAQALAFHGKLVRSTFTISCPPDTHGEITVIGNGDDAVERSAFVPNDLLLDTGDEVTVVGILEVLLHAPNIVNGQFIPFWVEIRISPAVHWK